MGLISSSGYSFEGLCAPLWSEMFNYARKLTRNDALAEDVVQDAMIKAMGAWERWSPEEMEPALAARAWMYRVVSSVAINAFRRVRLQTRSLHDRLPEMVEGMYGLHTVPERRLGQYHGVSGSGDEPAISTLASGHSMAVTAAKPFAGEAGVDAAAVSEEVEDAVARLHPDRREVIERYYFGGQTCEEIALELGVPAATVRTRLVRARDKLAPLLARFARLNGLTARVDAEPEPEQRFQPKSDGVDGVVRRDDRGTLRRLEITPDQPSPS